MANSTGLTRLTVNNKTVGAGSLYIPQNTYASIRPIRAENDFNIGDSSYTIELWYKPNNVSYSVPVNYSGNIGSNIWRKFYNRTSGAFLYEDMGPIGTMSQAALPAPVQSFPKNLRINYSGYFTTFSSDPLFAPGGSIQIVAGVGFGEPGTSTGAGSNITITANSDIAISATISYGEYSNSMSVGFGSLFSTTHIIYGTRPLDTTSPWTWSIPLNALVAFSCDVSSRELTYGLSGMHLGTCRLNGAGRTSFSISPELRYLIPYNQATGYLVGKSDASTGWSLLHVDRKIQLFNPSPITTATIDGAPVYSRAVTTGNVINDTNKWYHIAAVQDSSLTTNNIKIFIDGVLSAQGTLRGADAFVDSSAEFRIGRSLAEQAYGTPYPASHGIDGYIENLKITKGVAKYNSNFTPTVFG